jgi:hypothetical protein
MISPLAMQDLAVQRHNELRNLAAECRRPSVPWLPRWRVSWTRTRLSPTRLSPTSLSPTRLSPAKEHAGDSLVIIISATRVA